MKKKMFIFGTGSISEIAYYYFKNESNYTVNGFVDYKKFIKNKKKFNLPVIEFEKVQKFFPRKDFEAFVAVGYKELNQYRTQIYNVFKKKKYKLASFISANSNIASNVTFGDNCFILENQTIQPYTKIGNNVTLWCGNIIGHHCKIEDNCFITSNVVISGNCKIGNSCFIGIKSAVKDGIKIGSNSVLFMNSTIGKNMKKFSTSVSNLSQIFEINNKNIISIRKKYFFTKK